MEVLNVKPLSRDLSGLVVVAGVLGIFCCVGSGGGGDLYLGLGFGLARGLFPVLLTVLGEDFGAADLVCARLLSESSFGIGGTGGTPFCPPTTIRDFRLEDLVASR
jgi:hypothetical protein